MTPRKAAARPKSRPGPDKRALLELWRQSPDLRIPEWVADEDRAGIERTMAWPADRWDVRITYQHEPETITC